MKTLLAGEGAVADATAGALIEQGHTVRLLSPAAEIAARRWPHGVEAWAADPARSSTLEGAADGCDAVIQVGTVHEPWSTAGAAAHAKAAAVTRIDLRGTRRLAAEAQRAGAARFVLLSSLRDALSASEDGRALRQAEEIARTYRGAWSVVRAGLVYAPGEGALSALATMVRTLPVIPLIEGGRMDVQPLWCEDLGRALARAAEAPEAAGRVLSVAGPERARLSDVIDRLCAIVGRRPVRVPLPSLVASMGADAAALLGLPLPARAAALAELDGECVLGRSVENALTSVLGVTPTLLEDGLRKLVAEVPAQTPSRSEAPLRRQRLHVEIEGSHLGARALRDAMRRKARAVLQLEDGPPEGRMIKTGSLLSARVPARGFVALRVVEVARDGLTALTVEGDPRAGLVTFHFRDLERTVQVEIVVEAAPTSLVDRVLAGAAGGALADLDWPAALERIVALSGGTAPAGVQRDVETLDADEAARVRERADRLRVARLRASAPRPKRAAGPPATGTGRPAAPRGRPRTSGGPRSRARLPGPP